MRVRLMSLLLCGVLLLAVTAGTAPVRTSAAGTANPKALVATYFDIFNSIMKGGSTSQLTQIYTPSATLVVATPDGQTSTFHGLQAITGWYKAFKAGHVGLQAKEVNVRVPMPGMVIHYELAYNAANTLVGKCAHIFAVVNGMIVSDDFIVYWGH
jgi:hypothetical protein